MVYIPAEDRMQVMEGQQSAADSDGIKFSRMERGKAVFTVQSGCYTFRVPYHP
jgi:transketolase C-terminal domain/subunit